MSLGITETNAVTVFLLTEDACISAPCRNGATCETKAGLDYACVCATGFEGKNCQRKIRREYLDLNLLYFLLKQGQIMTKIWPKFEVIKTEYMRN